jgi:hypothetical protein
MTKEMTNEEAIAAIDHILDELPESLTDKQVSALLLGILLTYTGSFSHSMAVILELTLRLRDFAERNEFAKKSNAH